jgi:tetratricopeptide (TPR) repeat protein
MLNATGGDAAAIAEIAAAFSLLNTQQSPVLLAALRLAWHRGRLTDRNTNMPTQLPATWGALGQPIRAEALARSITDPFSQAQALADLAQAVIDTGDHDRATTLAEQAETIAHTITDPYSQAQALTGLARAAADTGDHDRATTLAEQAETIAHTITDWDSRAQALTSLADAAADTGDHGRAETIARTINDPYWQAQALTSLARAAADTDDHDRATTLAEKAETIARTITDPHSQAQALTALASVVEPTHARAIIGRALAVGHWTVSLDAMTRIDPTTVQAFLRDLESLSVV